MKIKVLSLLFSGVSFFLLILTGIFTNIPGNSSLPLSESRVLSDTTGSSPTPTTFVCISPNGGCGTNYYWNTSTCSCQPSTTTCISPSGGCGTNYYWNTSTCSCQPSTTTCISPQSGCGGNYYWNSSTCSCQPTTTTCISPSGGCGTNYYWNTSTCSCQPSTTTCISPQSGCGSNYYWNSATCSCQATANTCAAPSGGCGTYYYWDSGSCSCRAQAGYCVPPYGGCPSGKTFNTTTCECVNSTNCVSPSAGCGTNYYWNTSSCSCQPATTNCVSPTSGCGTNYYWDSGSCSCKYSGTSSGCISPSAGCGTNYYWNSSSCSCQPSTTTCISPQSGCGSNYYWDSSACYCRPYTNSNSGSCTLPTNGCGTNYYWDSGSCSCKYYQYTTTTTCITPAAGCGDNYTWDSSSCYCKPKSTTAICSVPAAGCGTGWYWDQPSCSCKSQSDPTTYYSSLTSSTLSQSFDRFSYEPPERIVCIKSYLTEPEYQKLRYFVPQDQNGFDEIRKLGEKAGNCWLATTTVRLNTNVTTTYSSPIDSEKCLIDGLGNDTYRAIYEGKRTPTYQEHLVFEKCNGRVKADSISYLTTKQEIPASVKQCLKSALTAELFAKVSTGSKDVPPELRKTVDRCFGTDPQPFEEGSRYKVPEEIKSCLQQSLGQSLFDEIASGKREPGKDEKTKADICFAKLNKTQEKFLPPPPEKIHFTETDTKTVNLELVSQNKENKVDGTEGGNLKIKGKGPAGSIVYIYIFSDPIVVTTKTDENGDWVYELNQPLEGEKHIAYAAVKSSSGKMVKSSVFDFTVVAAEEELAIKFIDEQKTAEPVRTNFLAYSLLFVSTALMITGFLYIVFFQKDLRRQNGGDGKGETASGSVN